ncbi:bahd acyltransferase [Mactra antiquata]
MYKLIRRIPFAIKCRHSQYSPMLQIEASTDHVMYNAPEFENLPREVWLYPTTTAGTFVYHITYDDIDSDDKSSLFVTDTTEDPTSFFHYDRTTNNVYVTTNPQPGTYTMTFKVQDQCLNSNTGVLTIQVLNWAPIITNLPGFAVIPETTNKVVELFTIQITDRDNATLNEVAALNVVPNSGSSNVAFRSHGLNDANRTLISVDGASYDYNTAQQYIMDITLTDETTQTGQGYFMLYITKNDPPKFTNLNNRAYVNVSYLSTAIGDTVYIVSATDADNDPLTYSMTCSPALCPLEMTSTEGAGVISATSDFIRTYVTGWDIEITVTDGFTTVGPKILTVLVQEIKDKPRFVNLPLSHGIGIHENTPLGTTVYTVQYIDIDPNDNHTITATFDPTWANNYFLMNSTSGALTTEFNIIDYEEVTDHSIIVTIRVSDDYDWSDDTLTIHIRNVNEAPSFHQTMYTLEPPEEGTIGGSAGDWRPIVNDPDTYVMSTNEVHTYTWDCGTLTRHFLMDSTDGSLTYSTTFDYDKVNFTTPYDCVVTVTDKAGLSATTTLQISITDLNDNAPVFALTTDYYIFQVPTLDPGRFVGQVTATDADRTSLNSDIYYSWHTYPTTLQKDFIVINDYGNIYVNETWTEPLFDYGVSYELVVLAENIDAYNNGRMTATATVTLFLSGTTTTTEFVTDRPLEFIEDNKNVAWVSVATGLLSVILILSCVFIMVYTVQVKRYRWCIPWCRKRILGLKKMTDREKRKYYRALLKEEELEELGGSDSDKTEMCDYGVESDDEPVAPPMMWDRLQLQGKTSTRGPTVRKASSVPQPALYEEPKPPLKSQSRMMKSSTPKIWT